MRSLIPDSWLASAALATALAACGDRPPAIVVGEVEFSTPGGSLASRLTATGDTVILSWLEARAEGRHALQVAMRVDGVWMPPRTVVEDDSFFANWADLPAVVTTPAGPWLATWLERTAPDPYAYHVRAAWSPDQGRTWGEPFRLHADTSPTEHGFVSLVRDGRGAAVLWLDGRRKTGTEGPMTLRFARVPASQGPADEVEVDGSVCDCCQTAMASTGAGLLVAYRDRAEGEIRDIVARRLTDAGWSDAVKVADDGWYYPGCPVNGPAVATRGDTVGVVWFTGAGDVPRVYAAFSFDGGASFGPRVRVDDGRPAGRVDAAWWGNTLLASWTEETATAGEVRVRPVLPSGEARAATVIAQTSAARAAGFPRLVAAGGDVVVAWTQPGEGGGVRVATLTLGS
jgi:hypothetical protein